MVHRYGDVLAGVMHKTPLYVHVQNQYSKNNGFISSYITSVELFMSITDKKKWKGGKVRKRCLIHKACEALIILNLHSLSFTVI